MIQNFIGQSSYLEIENLSTRKVGFRNCQLTKSRKNHKIQTLGLDIENVFICLGGGGGGGGSPSLKFLFLL